MSEYRVHQPGGSPYAALPQADAATAGEGHIAAVVASATHMTSPRLMRRTLATPFVHGNPAC